MAQSSYLDKHVKVALRMIGHQILLQNGDSSSRVLPIINQNNQYEIQFEAEFSFQPEELVEIVDQVAMETEMANHYIVEVLECDSRSVVYSYEMNHQAQNNLGACNGRKQPKGCYSLVFTLIETPWSIGAVYAESPNGPEPKKEKSLLSYGGLIGMLGIGAVAFFFFWSQRKKPVEDPNMIPLGQYRFDQRNTELIINNQKIELTSKEADLLLLLYDAANSTIDRAEILHKVWGDEGAYVGRTLDVFISKLRKKLQADPEVKIVNIRGVGYKLVVNG